MGALENIIGILDMDGFLVNGLFYCKELGALRVGDLYATSHIFDIGLRWNDLSNRTKKQCQYLTRYIHRLPFGVPRGISTKRLDELNDIVLEFYEQNKVNDMSKLAYKGGHLERDLLAQLGVPGVNLEHYGCPKANKLFNQLGWLETCGAHTSWTDYEHCSKVEVEAFGIWLNKNLV